MSWLSYLIPRIIYKSSSPFNKKIEVREINGKNVLLVNRVQQSGAYTEGLWRMGLKGLKPKDILVFGVGGGTVFGMFPETNVTGVDIDGKIIDIAKKYFGLQKATLIEKDARLFTTDQKFDLVIIDLYIGNDVPEFATNKDFLLRCKKFLRKNGQMIINYYNTFEQEKKAMKIASYFQKTEVKSVLRNMFIYVIK